MTMGDELRRPWFIALVLMVAAALVAATASVRLSDPIAGALERAGYPGDYDAMGQAWMPPVDEDDNPARIVVDAAWQLYLDPGGLALHERIKYLLADESGRWHGEDEEALQTVRQTLADHEAVLHALLAIESPENARYSALLGCSRRGFGGMLGFSALATLLDWALKEAILRNDYADAVRAMNAHWNLCFTLEKELCPDFRSNWQTAMSRAINATREVLHYGGLDAEQLEVLAATLTHSRTRAERYALRKSLAAWPARLEATRRHVARQSILRPKLPGIISDHYYNIGFGPSDRTVIAHAKMQEVVLLQSSFHWEPRLREIPGTVPPDVFYYHFMYDLSRPGPMVRNLVDHDVLVGVVAVERYRAETGAYPDSLEALVPRYLDAVPQDLYDRNRVRAEAAAAAYQEAHGHPPTSHTELTAEFVASAPPIKYRLDPETYTVYSTGTNETDYGGVKQARDDKPGDLVYRDIVVVVPRR